jgi:class 3 adenylate cyclase/tetratricopeptide (TPR) repeat protein
MKACPECQHQNPPQANFCSNCGAKLDARSRNKTQDKKKRPAERRQLTMLFCDLVDSTALSESLDPEEYRQVITDYHHLAEAVVNQHKGHVANYLGDGLLVYFGYPVGLEDAPRVAVRAGLRILEALNQANSDWIKEGKTEIKLRIGIHTGLTVVDEHLALGEAVNIAARLEGLAPHNGLVVSPQTRHLISGWFEMSSLGSHRLKGISQPMEVFQVLKETGVSSPLEMAKRRGLTPMVGRDIQITNIKNYWELAKTGQSELVLIHGEPGIGKSRLIDTITDFIAADQEAMVLLAGSSMYHQHSAFYPLIEMMGNQIFELEASSDPENKIDQLKSVVENLQLDAKAVVPIVAELLALSSEQYPPMVLSSFAKRHRTMETITELIMKFASDKTLLLVLEDLHWADASTVEWLVAFLKQKEQKHFLVLASARPEFDTELLGDDLNQIDLQRLSTEETASICQHQTKGKMLPPEILGEIASKTDGVPLFVEELTKNILEGDLLVEQEDRYQVVKPVSAVSIPATLQDSLLARLDRLDEIKEIVQIGAVIGSTFSKEVLKEIIQEAEIELEQALRKLMEVDILKYKSVGAQSVYQFKHALIQDTAYDSLLRSDRKRIHQQVASVLENKFSSTSGNQPEILAHHYSEAGELVKAVPLWLQAGQKASKNNATTEAVSHLKKGIDLLGSLGDIPESKEWEVDLLLTLGGTFVVSLGFPHPKVKETFDQARAIAQTMGASPKLALILFNLLSYYFNTEDYRSVDKLSEHMLDLSLGSEHRYWFELFATHLISGGQLLKGDFLTATDAFKREIEMFRPELPFPWELTPSGYPEICAKAWLMLAKYAVGDFEQARSLCEGHLAFAEDHKDSMTLYHIYTFPALYKLEAREWDEAERFIKLYFPIVREFGDPVFILTAEVYYDIAIAFQGDQEAFNKVVQSINVCFQIGFRAFAVTMSYFIGELYLKYGQPEEGLKFIDRVLDHVNKTGTHIHTAELHRVKGMALRALGKPPDQVDACFNQAINIAKEQSTRTFELRAKMELAKLWQEQGKAAEGHQLLQAMVQSFTDGAAPVDLREAMDLISKLKG